MSAANGSNRGAFVWSRDIERLRAFEEFRLQARIQRDKNLRRDRKESNLKSRLYSHQRERDGELRYSYAAFGEHNVQHGRQAVETGLIVHTG